MEGPPQVNNQWVNGTKLTPLLFLQKDITGLLSCINMMMTMF